MGVELIVAELPRLNPDALFPIVVEKSEVVATSKPAGGVTTTGVVPLRLDPETVKEVLEEAVP